MNQYTDIDTLNTVRPELGSRRKQYPRGMDDQPLLWRPCARRREGINRKHGTEGRHPNAHGTGKTGRRWISTAASSSSAGVTRRYATCVASETMTGTRGPHTFSGRRCRKRRRRAGSGVSREARRRHRTGAWSIIFSTLSQLRVLPKTVIDIDSVPRSETNCRPMQSRSVILTFDR